MEYKYYDQFINKKTIGRVDVTPLFENPVAFARFISDIVRPFQRTNFNKVAGLDALGFIIGGAVANKLKKGFVAVRKDGKLPGIPGTTIKTSFVDYTKKKKYFEINKNAVKKGDKVLIVDEWIETGSQVKAAIKLIEKQGGEVIGIACLCAERKGSTKILFEKYNCHAIRIS